MWTHHKVKHGLEFCPLGGTRQCSCGFGCDKQNFQTNSGGNLVCGELMKGKVGRTCWNKTKVNFHLCPTEV